MNKGVGPAIIKEIEFRYKDSAFQNSREVFQAMFGETIKGVGFSDIGKDNVFIS